MKLFGIVFCVSFLFLSIAAQAVQPINCQIVILGKIAEYQKTNYREFSDSRKSLKELESVIFSTKSESVIMKGKSLDGKKCSATVFYKTVGPMPEGCPEFAIAKVTSNCK